MTDICQLTGKIQVCLLGEEITGKRLGESGDFLSSHRELSTRVAFQSMRANIFYSAFCQSKSRTEYLVLLIT